MKQKLKEYFINLGYQLIDVCKLFLKISLGFLVICILILLFGNDSSGTSLVGRSLVKSQVAVESTIDKVKTPYKNYADSLRKSND